jgi:hypothetical protein
METIVIIIGSLLLIIGLFVALRTFISVGHINYSYFRMERESRLISQEAMKSTLDEL